MRVYELTQLTEDLGNQSTWYATKAEAKKAFAALRREYRADKKEFEAKHGYDGFAGGYPEMFARDVPTRKAELVRWLFLRGVGCDADRAY
jgi:hypothetical protein